jgi:hypothetical protein
MSQQITLVVKPRVAVISIAKRGPQGPAGAAGGSYTENVAIANTSMLVNNQYLVNKGATLCILTLPASATLNSKIKIDGNPLSVGGWRISLNAGNIIYAAGGTNTTSGVAGFILSTDPGDSIELRALSTTSWLVVNMEGNPSFN